MSEHLEQVALFEWAAISATKYPELELLFAVPNGGARHIAVARKLKKEGVKQGVPDLFLPVVRGGYSGLWIEMKFGKNGLTKAQELWLSRLKQQGYQVAVHREWVHAAKEIENYLQKGK